MPKPLLTDRQKMVIQYRKDGLTQQEIADLLQTTRSNISLIEKSANENIRLAKEALAYVYSQNSTLICTLAAGSELTREAYSIYKSARQLNIKVQYDTGALINRIMLAVPEKLAGTTVKEDINIYLNSTGIIYVY
ncbi:Tfx family DNA-binding protein [Methanocorpusculum labreanum]|nr:Tfx family DNA-binding protein [Methanocorpusculum labreanum]